MGVFMSIEFSEYLGPDRSLGGVGGGGWGGWGGGNHTILELLYKTYQIAPNVAPNVAPMLLPCCSRVAPVLLPRCSRVAPVPPGSYFVCWQEAPVLFIVSIVFCYFSRGDAQSRSKPQKLSCHAAKTRTIGLRVNSEWRKHGLAARFVALSPSSVRKSQKQ